MRRAVACLLLSAHPLLWQVPFGESDREGTQEIFAVDSFGNPTPGPVRIPLPPLVGGKSALYGMRQPALRTDDVKLELRIKIVRQQYCRGDHEIGFVRFKLQLDLRNAGEEGILLPNSAASVSRVMVAASEQAFRSRAYAVTFGPDFMVSAGGPGRDALEKAYFALMPGEVRTREDTGTFPIRILEGGATSPGPGEYWLGIWARTWLPDVPVPSAWLQQGGPDVFTGSVMSNPIRFRIDPAPRFGVCD